MKKSIRSLVSLFFALLSLSTCTQAQSESFSWNSIQPTQNINLTWHRCNFDFECTTLEVPLDYTDPTGPKATIALTRMPASVPRTSEVYKGPILFNPGGPGQSGIDFIHTLGYWLAIELGPQFDLVGFDPRGIARSTPRVSLFKTQAERTFFEENYLKQMVNGSGEGVSKAWGLGHVIGKLATAHNAEENGYLEHINTPNTSRDMLRIVESFGREKLMYWGISYGTVLGATFATMFPDKVERMVLDGVVNMDDYYNLTFSDDLQDAPTILTHFFDACASAGPTTCAFHEPSPSRIKSKYLSLANQIRNSPIPVYYTSRFDGRPVYGLLDYSKFQTVVFYSLYSPYAWFPRLAEALAALHDDRNPQPFFELGGARAFECPCEPDHEDELDRGVVVEGAAVIACSDGARIPPGLEEMKQAFAEFSAKSEWAGVWAWGRMSCLGWPKKTPGPALEGPYVANTSHPILFIGNTADPVTPLAHAKKVSKGFPGSVVLTQDAPGHGSMTTTSYCTQLHIREYFNNGTLPEDGTVCDVATSLFPSDDFDNESTKRTKRDLLTDSLSATGSLEGVDVEQWMDAVEKISKEAAARRVYGPL
ncbi:hypothetical protein CC2G_011100 [Coprinopsis cinerea AmutBmut pab1-1]|nr:hypothetical protein CC2G_011100 [Coprinopsis cinerea AmutBmut pab1-1]